MAKLDLNDLRRNAQNAQEAAAKAAAYRADLFKGLRRLLFECSPDGIIALLTMAHMSLIADGFPTEVRLDGKDAPFKGDDTACRMEVDGAWTCSAPRSMPEKGLRPAALAAPIAAASHIPPSTEALDSIRAVINPLHDRDFEHFSKVLDLIPLRSLSAMMAHGPILARSLELGPKPEDIHEYLGVHEDISRFAKCIGDAIKRRGASVEGLDEDVRKAVERFLEEIEESNDVAHHQVVQYLPTCVQMFDPHVSVAAIECFLSEAVRTGFDINAVASNPYTSPKTVAERAVNLLDVKALGRLEKLGLDIGRAAAASSLTSVVLSRIRRDGDRKTAFSMLKHLIGEHGQTVEIESYRDLDERVVECKRNIHSGYADNKKLVAKYEFLMKVLDHVDERFPDLQSQSLKRRRAA